LPRAANLTRDTVAVVTSDDLTRAQAEAMLAVLRRTRLLGYMVSVFRIPSMLFGSPGHEGLTALDLSTDPPTRHTAKVMETEPGDLDYRSVCMLADSVGVTLGDG
jgi:hypothetical protein